MIERLTAEDRLMLWPDQIWPQDIGALITLDAAELLDAGGRFRIEAVTEAISGRLHLVPRFRQVLQVPSRFLGGPLWVDAPSFDISEHIGVAQLPWPGDEAQLLDEVERLRRRRLDRIRPLWEMWFLPGMSEGRVGLYVRMHHSIADGIAGIATVGAFLDATQEVVVTPGEASWVPIPGPTDRELFLDDARRRFEAVRRAISMVARPLSTMERAAEGWPAMRELVAERPLPATSLDRVVGPNRSWALIRSSLDQVRDVAHGHAATVNDVLLTVTAGGLRGLLRHRGEPLEGVMRVYVPISLRQGQFAGARGNSIAEMMVPLPIGVSDPVRRLEQIAAETAERKRRPRASLGKLPQRGVPGIAFLKLLRRQRVNVTTANLPGPPIPLYLVGARVLEVFPVFPLIGNVSLGVGALSYAGHFNITAIADGESYPDIDVFAASVREELEQLAPDLETSGPIGRQPRR